MLLDKLFSFLSGDRAMHRTAMVANVASNVVTAFEQEFQQDGNAKDAAIDTLIGLLQQHKTFTSPAQGKTVALPSVPNPVPANKAVAE